MTQEISSASTDFLAGGGEMGERIRTFDWSTTPLGAIESWPQSLLTLVATSIRSRFPIVIWWNRHDYTTFYNDAYISFLGKTKHPGWLGRSGRECWKEIWPTIGPMLESVFESGQSTWSEDLLLVLDRNLPREEAYFTFSYSAIPGANGSVDGIFCACTETTRRVVGERRLQTLRDLAGRSSEARSAEEACEIAARLLAQNNTDIPFALIYLLDGERTAAHLVALSSLSPESQAAVRAIPLSQSRCEGTWPLAMAAREGKPVPVDLLAGDFGALPAGPWPESPDSALVLPLRAPGQNQVTGFLVVGINPRCVLDEPYRDFLNLVAGHVATAVANARAFEEERKRAEALAELDRAKTLFFSNVSHEFRTPLTLMLGPIEEMLAENSALSVEQRERIEILHRNALRLLKLVNTLLDFSRLEAGRVQAVYEATDLTTLTTDLASSFRSVIERAGMRLTVDCPPLAQPVYVDHGMWEKILLNLLSNAFKYTFEGEIGVTLRQRAASVEVSVADTGFGIPAEELPHMFERFHRVKGSVGRTFEGSGIGLSLVQELVKLHGGSINVRSTPGRGSTFTVSLPLGTAHLPQERIAGPRATSMATGNAQFYVNEALALLAGEETVIDMLPDVPLPADGRQSAGEVQAQPARILFADDNADMREYVSRLLQSRYSVQTVPDGRAALAAIKESPPDLVLTDVMMPGIDGFELLQTLRANPETRTLPVILLSARAGEEAKIEGMQVGADDYLIKPFSARELLARVAAHLEMARLRREAEAQVRAERQRLQDLFMQAPALIAVLRGPDHVFELANPLYMQTVGQYRHIIGKPIREALPELEGQGFYELLDTVYQAGKPFVGNEILVHLDRKADGTLEDVYFNFVYQPSYNARGEIDGILAHAVDITEQVRARRRVEESEEYFRTLADNISQFAWMADETGWIFWYNRRWYEYTGTSLAEMEGWGWRKVHHPGHVERVVEKISRCFASGEAWEDTFPLLGKDGTYRWFLSRAIPIHNEQGRVIRWFGTNTDITERKQVEQQKDEFIGVASHELKTPVTSVKAYTQLLERRFQQSGDARSAELLHKMDLQLNKLTDLIGDLLDVTKIESGKLQLHKTSFDLHTLIREIVEETQRTTTTHRILLDLSISVPLFADRDRIGQVLTNLLTNAIKYSPKAETILVKTVCTGQEVVTSVQDFGIGIAREKQEHIFERFFRVEGETQATYPGLGLGLYISAEFVKRHQGSMRVESEEGKGTTITFSLPMQKAEALNDEEG